MTDGGTVKFDALVTDPDGLGDILAGQLTSPDGMLVYGSFTESSPGSWSLSLSWSQLSTTMPVTMDPETRQFRAYFTDTAANDDEATASLDFTCSGLDLCSGDCVDLSSDNNNCYTCGHACPNGSTCSVIGCTPQWSACTYVTPPSATKTCDAICAKAGETCVYQGCSGLTARKSASNPICASGSGTTVAATCGQDLNTFGAGFDYDCCCSDTQ